MAILSDPDRVDVWADFMRHCSAERSPLELTKADLRAAVDAGDAWVEVNKAAFNAALPLPARTALTAVQKAKLLVWTIRKRYEKGV